MALVVETGAGIPNADAYSTLVWIDVYQAARGRTSWASSAATSREEAVRRGTRSIDILFRDRWPGQRTYGRAGQGLDWPRKNVITTEGDALASDAVPIEVQEAAAEASWIELNEVGALLPTASEQIEKSVTIGPISVTYADSYMARVETYIPYLEKFLWNVLLGVSYGGTGTQWLLRA